MASLQEETDNPTATPSSQINLELPPEEQDADFLQELNALESATRNLPPEILSDIFLYVWSSEENDKTRYHRVLSTVCSRWRRVIESTPEFWTFIKLGHVTTQTVEKRAEYLRLCLWRSGGRPLRLTILFLGIISRNHELVCRDVDGLLLENKDRIQSLTLDHPPTRWYEFIAQLGCLASLEIKSPPSRSYALSFPNKTNVNHLALSHTVLSLGDLPMNGTLKWTTVTCVDLNEVAIDTCVMLLFSCPNLETFLCNGPTDPLTRRQDNRGIPTKPVILHHLKRLRWPMVPNEPNSESSAWCHDILRYINVPNLERFEDSDKSWSYENELVAFIDRLPLTINTLVIDGVRRGFPFESETTLLLFSQRNIRIERLELGFCNEKFVFDVLKVMSLEALMLYPYLKHISLVHCYLGDNSGRQPDMLLVKALEGRGRHVKEFRLEAMGAVHFEPSPFLEETFARWDDSGFRVMVYWGGFFEGV